MQKNNPQNICHQLLDPSRSHSCAPPPQETFQDHQVGLLQAPLKWLLLSSIPVPVRFCAIPLRVKPVSPGPVALLQLSPAGLQILMLLPMPDPRVRKPHVGLRTLTPVGERL